MGNVPRMCFRPARLTISPCKDCEDREMGCHSSCERYKSYRDNTFADFVARRDAYVKENDVDEYAMRVKMKNIGKRRKV